MTDIQIPHIQHASQFSALTLPLLKKCNPIDRRDSPRGKWAASPAAKSIGEFNPGTNCMLVRNPPSSQNFLPVSNLVAVVASS